MLSVHVAYDVKKQREKGVKTDVPRRVPVHPVLARVLAEWKLHGWELTMGRAPTRDDLVVPTPEGKHRGKPRDSRPSLKKFHSDLDRLQLRRRRQHDLRRSFVTLCLADGARKDVLRWVTHGPEGDIIDLYTTLPWEALCNEVAKLKIEWRVGRVIPFSRAASADDKCAKSDEQGTGVYYPFTTPDQNVATSQKKTAEVHGNRTRRTAALAEHHRL